MTNLTKYYLNQTLICTCTFQQSKIRFSSAMVFFSQWRQQHSWSHATSPHHHTVLFVISLSQRIPSGRSEVLCIKTKCKPIAILKPWVWRNGGRHHKRAELQSKYDATPLSILNNDHHDSDFSMYCFKLLNKYKSELKIETKNSSGNCLPSS